MSIIIPTYNMEKLLPCCLDSLVNSNQFKLIEAIVVNDGSKDHSLQVARQYENKYPESVTVIDKPNGNYGSTVNAALPVAKGKYIKVLDSDDKFDTAQLDELVNALSRLDCDMVITHFTQWGPGSRKEVIKYNTMGREPYQYGKIYQLDDVLKDGYIRFFLMHALTYRTQMLRDMNYHQTESISYTDTEWSSYPTFYAQTIAFLNLNVYQYNMDREGQTMDPKILLRSIGQMQEVTDQMILFYDNYDMSLLSNTRKAFLKQYYENRMRILFKIFLLDMPREQFNAVQFAQVFNKYSTFIDRHDMHIKLYPENKVLRIDYINFWNKHHKRWPVWLEKLNVIIDGIVKELYLVLFRR